jgi:two-component system sensor histidine kinase KdpD
LSRTGDERAATIEQEADRLTRLVADVLDLSSVNAGALRLQPEITAAEDLIGAALQRVAGMQRARAIGVELPSHGSIAAGRFDFTHSLRILVNLLENALKYSPDDKPIDVRVRTTGDWLHVDVIDRGPGVPLSEREHIFEPFFRTPAATRVAGPGLGLTIARALAQAQGGALMYEPRAGGGSIFTLRLPRAIVPQLNDATSTAPESAEDGRAAAFGG